ncbi:MAG: hypothetical protein C5B59_08665 [Bacteroidetes bacterium]|nr:MAG: hypothetical protein C5B59_08665 [Bacteroidota bacterium]
MREYVQKTHCIHGHELSGKNVRQIINRDGTKNGRQCIRCTMERKLKSLYGISFEKREALLQSQGRKCAICEKEIEFGKTGFKTAAHVDHDHNLPGTHRGILCGKCNLALGDIEPHLGNFLAYLERYGII